MRNKLQAASGIAVAATMLTALAGAPGSDALAQAAEPVLVPAVVQLQALSGDRAPQTQELPAAEAPIESTDQSAIAPVARAASLAEHVRAQPRAVVLDNQMRCLAGAIYFEARGESLAGQLAVGRVVVDRSKSGRFPASYCGVVYQRAQFSFVRGQTMPVIRENTAAWQNAVAVARIADDGSWQGPTDGALFFHAARVSPGWRLTRMARIDNHVFYR